MRIFALTLLIALPLGLVICFGTMNQWAPFAFVSTRAKKSGPLLRAVTSFCPIRILCKVLVWIIRGSPLLLQVLIVFYGPPILFGVKALPRFGAALGTFAVNYACYFSEIYRGGIQSIPVGQQEAGLVLGMTKRQIFFRVTLLQLVKRVIPPMGNEFITLVKDTALVRVISVYEIIWAGESFIKKGMIWPLFFTAIYYLVFSGVLTLLFGWVEKKLDYFK